MSETLPSESTTHSQSESAEAAPSSSQNSSEGATSVSKQKSDLAGKANSTQMALRRVMERRSGNSQTDSSSSGEEQAAPAGESTPEQAADDSGVNTGTQTTSDDDQNGLDQSDSTVTAPDNWPAQLRDQFNQIADNNARHIVVDLYKNLQGGFTKAMQKLSQSEHELSGLVELNKQFKTGQDGAKKVLSDLAKQANLEIWFEKPLPEGDVPEFKDAREMALWAKAEAKREYEKDLQAAKQADSQKADNDAFINGLKVEIEAALKSIPGFNDHAGNVANILRGIYHNKRPTVEQAYMIATYPTVQKLAGEANAAKAEVKTLKAEIESLKKKATVPPTNSKTGNGEVKSNDKQFSSTKRAMQRVLRKKAAANAKI